MVNDVLVDKHQPQNLRAALAYLTVGFNPMPLCWPTPEGQCGCGRNHQRKDIGKAPLLASGWQNMRPAEAGIRQWWTFWPEANIGVLLEPSGLLVGDFDSEEGLQEAAKLGLPLTPVASTGKGWHYYYATPPGLVGRSTKRGESKSIDILAAGYVVAPPSLHSSGRQYSWAILPEEAAPQPAPDWMVRMLTERTTAQAIDVELPNDLPEIEAGTLPISNRMRLLLKEGAGMDQYASRSEALFAVVSAMVQAGCDDATIAGAIWASPVGEKARHQGQQWLAREIGRARAKTLLVDGGPIIVRPDGLRIQYRQLTNKGIRIATRKESSVGNNITAT